jgi:uncharacterized protein (TIGR00290 family)
MEKAAIFWSGGKDAALALYKVQQEGHYQVETLVTTMNATFKRVSMHGVREEMIEKQAAAIGIPLFKMWMPDISTNEAYETVLLSTFDTLKDQGITTIIYGDIFLEDLRQYREQLASLKGLKLHFPLWKQPSAELIEELLLKGFKTVTCCINTASLNKTFLGREIDLEFINELPPSVDPCGENGEFHSFCFNGPIFGRPLAYTTGEEKFSSLPSNTDGQEHKHGFWFIDIISEE